MLWAGCLAWCCAGRNCCRWRFEARDVCRHNNRQQFAFIYTTGEFFMVRKAQITSAAACFAALAVCWQIAVAQGQGVRPKSADRSDGTLDLTLLWSRGQAEGRGPIRFTHSPMRLEDIERISPYGLMIGGHVCPIDHGYFYTQALKPGQPHFDVMSPADADEPLRTKLLSFNPRKAKPLGGRIDHDIDGKLVGNWYREATGGYAGLNRRWDYWVGHLTFAYHHVDPSQVIISIGDVDGKARTERR
jgi:hypothetical protein